MTTVDFALKNIRCPATQKIGMRGFNLLPYRQREARRARRRCLIEWATAIFIGCVAVSIWAAQEIVDRARLDDERAALEATLATLEGPLNEYRQLERARSQRRVREALALKQAQPHADLQAFLDVLSQAAHAGVTLHALRYTGHEIELIASALHSEASATWLKQLSRAPGVTSSEVSELRVKSRSPEMEGNANGHRVDFTARLRWRETLIPSIAPAREGEQ